MTGAERRTGRGLVPAVSEPFGRRPAVRAGRSALRERRRRRELHERRLRPVRRHSADGDPSRRRTRAAIPPPASAMTRPRQPPRAARCAAKASRRAAEPTLLNGAVLRVDPATGDGLPDNPLARQRRQRSAHRGRGTAESLPVHLRPGTDDVWIGDVGWDSWEEIDRIPTHGRSGRNFGWPCYEGDFRQSSYEGHQLMPSLDLEGSATEARTPHFTYNHFDHVAVGDGCATGSSSVTGLAFYEGGHIRAPMQGPCSLPTIRATASGQCPRGRTACPIPLRSRRSWLPQPVLSISRSDREATSSTPGSTTARSGASSTSPGTSRRSSSPRPLPRTAPLLSTCNSTHPARTIPIRGTRSATRGIWTATGPR